MFEGKIVNQMPKYTYDKSGYSFDTVFCARCDVAMSSPKTGIPIKSGDAHYYVYHYLPGDKINREVKDHYIYPTKSGEAVCYCSDYCRKKHNHRFRK